MEEEKRRRQLDIEKEKRETLHLETKREVCLYSLWPTFASKDVECEKREKSQTKLQNTPHTSKNISVPIIVYLLYRKLSVR